MNTPEDLMAEINAARWAIEEFFRRLQIARDPYDTDAVTLRCYLSDVTDLMDELPPISDLRLPAHITHVWSDFPEN